LPGIKSEVIETQRLGHAREAVEGLQLAELECYDGVIAVGGDGLFQEILTGLLSIRCVLIGTRTSRTQRCRAVKGSVLVLRLLQFQGCASRWPQLWDAPDCSRADLCG
jgi:Diacylglycerol kinase catalytic domain